MKAEDRKSRKAEFVAKADNAAEQAKYTIDPYLRASWAKIEAGYREIAEKFEPSPTARKRLSVIFDI
jgi:hypothetical protein